MEDNGSTPREVVWKTDFEGIEVDIELPDFALAVAAGALLDRGSRLVELITEQQDFARLQVRTLPDADLHGVTLEVLPASGRRSVYQGPIPEGNLDWLLPTSAFQVQHQPGESPTLLWGQSPDADYIHANYFVRIGSTSFLWWSVLAPTDTRIVTYPELPAGLLTSTPDLEGELQSGFAFLSAFEFSEVNGYQDALASGYANIALYDRARLDYLRDNSSKAIMRTQTFWEQSSEQ